MFATPPPFGLYNPAYERANCGVGAVANVQGKASHEIIETGREVLNNLLHRGATGSDECTGDGAGIMLAIPHALYVEQMAQAGMVLPEKGAYAVGMFFLNPETPAEQVESIVAEVTQQEEFTLIGWRTIAGKSKVLGEVARKHEPLIRQVFIDAGTYRGEVLERRLFMLRRRIESRLAKQKLNRKVYICSLSGRSVVYKGMFIAPQLFDYYSDLGDERCTSSWCIVHQRYSTNTFPSWELAQPFRMLAHNGEINTLRGNLNRMRGRENQLESPLLGGDLHDIFPIVDPDNSDSAALDNVLELLVRAGRTVPHSMMMLIPESFGPGFIMSADRRAFYEYHAAMMEPWDGPAAVVFSDGRYVGATLDRNGLRPGRYIVTTDGLVVLASETGVASIPPERVRQKGRLQPGRLFLIDLEDHRIVSDDEIKSRIARQQPYRRWLAQNRLELRGLFGASPAMVHDPETVQQSLRMFGYTREELQMILMPMARNAQEPVGSMGTDTPLAVLSKRPQLLFNYFKQQFAQVTNPPIDPLREGLGMSLMIFAGPDRNLLEETPEHARKLRLKHPILTNLDMERLRGITRNDFRVETIDATWRADSENPGHSLRAALSRLVEAAAEAARGGAFLVAISDRAADADNAPIPSLLATAAVHQGLLARGLRDRVGLIIESGEPREVMHFATLSGFGATAVNPYLAFETLYELQRAGDLPIEREPGRLIEQYITAVKKGLMKTMSRMGISTMRSYRGAQLFEAVGLDSSLIEEFFPGTPSRIDGLGLDALAEETLRRHRDAFLPRRPGEAPLNYGGEYHLRVDGEQHAWNPQTIHLLQHAVRKDDADLYRQFSAAVHKANSDLSTLRGLLSFRPGEAIPLDEVEPASEIRKRFLTGAMSHGSISKEAHETLAIGMNRIGGASNTGEGGEDPARYTVDENGDTANSAIKQIASGRFGVTIQYLSEAKELQIKIAQGAKPGEGGQLPGFKVTEEIARLRYSSPGVTLISPPPHHDIYSIEDLAQLIYDLRCANPEANISVKLVAEVGVGAVAAGVVKAGADEVLISGHDGGTGASPLSSIKHTGAPWELGLAETQQVLMLNNLRDRVRLQTDGGLRTGRDVVVAALLGGERFGFGTVALVSIGCIMMRKCHLGTCPVGIATQDPRLREKFRGDPVHLERYMTFVAEEVREIMAQLGYRTFDEMVGQVGRLEMQPAIDHWKAHGVNLSNLLATAPTGGAVRYAGCLTKRTSDSLDDRLLPQLEPAFERGERVRIDHPIRNVDRTVGATISNRIVKRFGPKGMATDTVECIFRGSAGQSFGAFLAPGLIFRLIGDANDYLGKGLSGGRIVVHPPETSPFEPHENVIAGNTLLYGATSGEALIAGTVGERFAVRNSGATAVVEGVGDHACEYMTGGTVVVLGPTGRNFAAGMSGGIAYVLDERHLFDINCNLDMVELEAVHRTADEIFLRNLIDRHRRWTGSRRARQILDDWPEMVCKFLKVIPLEYRRVLERQVDEEAMVDAEAVPATEEVYRG